MKKTETCPKCACRKLFVVSELSQPSCDSINGVVPMHVAALPFAPPGGAIRGNEYRTMVGSFETWICSSCGYTEWYARNAAAALEALSKLPNSTIRSVDHSAAPYR